MTLFQAILIAIVEGITEFLPISSTGHMIITEAFLKTTNPEFTKLFTVCIQLGAILSVLVIYWKKFLQSANFYFKLFVAFIPAAVAGFLLGDFIDGLLESVLVVAIALLLGGIVLLFIDKIFNETDKSDDVEVSYPSAFKIGLFQCLALIPGVSRSAASIIGGMTQKLSRKQAAEFSFFLAVPTMFAATAYKLLKGYKLIQPEDIKMLAIGNLVAFIVALIAIRTFVGFLTKHGFKAFGYYRIAVGIILLVLLACGVDLKIS